MATTTSATARIRATTRRRRYTAGEGPASSPPWSSRRAGRGWVSTSARAMDEILLGGCDTNDCSLRHPITNDCSLSRQRRTNVCHTRGAGATVTNTCSSPVLQERPVPAAKYTPKKKELTDRQRQILDFIEAETTERGYPPSVREIGEAVGPHLALHRALAPGHAPAPRLPAPRPDQAPGHRGPLRPELGRRRPRAAPGAPRPARRRRRRRHRRAGPGERRGGPARCPPTSPATATCSCCGSGATR